LSFPAPTRRTANLGSLFRGSRLRSRVRHRASHGDERNDRQL